MANNKLNEEEICGFLKDMLNFTISREQVSNPNKEFVVGIYARFLSEFGVENVVQPDIIATSGMDNIERYEKNIILCNIAKSVANIVSNAGVPDMSYSDLVQPRKNRTIRIISALCMLYYKLTEIESKYQQMQSKCADLPLKRQAVEQRIRDFKKQMEEKAMFLSSNKSKSQGLAQELKELAKAYEAKKNVADQLADNSKQLKLQILNERERISEMDIDLSKTKEEINDWEQKIVKSPDRIQADTKEKEMELDYKRNEKKKLEKQCMELIRSVDFVREGSKALMPSLETFTEAFKEVEHMKSQCEGLCKTKLSISKKDEECKTLKIQIKEQEKTLHSLKTQISNNEKQYQKQFQTMKQLRDGMENDLKQKSKNKSEEEKNIMEETILLNKKLLELDDKHNAFSKRYQQLWDKNNNKLKEVETLVKRRIDEVRRLKEKQNQINWN